MIAVARDNFALTEYLMGQVLQSEKHRFAALRAYYPKAKEADWRLQVAGQRVQIIKPDEERGGVLEFGTELVAAEDRSLVALLGASPGASTAAYIAISLLEKCFPSALSKWRPRLEGDHPLVRRLPHRRRRALRARSRRHGDRSEDRACLKSSSGAPPA